MKKAITSQAFKVALLGAAMVVSAGTAAAQGPGHPRLQDRAGHHASHHTSHGQPGFHKAGHHGMGHHGKSLRGHGHAQMQRAGLVVPGYGAVSRDFVDGMGLSGEQLKLIEEARTAGKALRDTHRDRLKAQRDARGERFSAGALEPEQALKQADERREAMLAERRQVDQKWLAVWKSLDTGQQARVADHLKQKAEKAQKRAERFEARKKERVAAKVQRGEGKQGADTQV